MVDLSSSSDEEGLIPDTSCDEEFIRRLFGDLNCGVLGPPGDGKVIILSDSDKEEEEVCEEEAAGSKTVPTSAAGIPASTSSAADVDKAPKGCKTRIVVITPPDRDANDGSNGGDKASSF
jgi:hypothetical protein